MPDMTHAALAADAAAHEPPVIDAARLPLQAFIDSHKTYAGAVAHYTWLHFLRPVVIVLFWFVSAVFAYHHLFSISVMKENEWLLLLYASLVLLMVACMLYLGLYRRFRTYRRKIGDSHVPLDAMAESLHLPGEQLVSWQAARLLVAHHDGEGQIEKVDVLLDGDGQLKRPLRKRARVDASVKSRPRPHSTGPLAPPGH